MRRGGKSTVQTQAARGAGCSSPTRLPLRWHQRSRACITGTAIHIIVVIIVLFIVVVFTEYAVSHRGRFANVRNGDFLILAQAVQRDDIGALHCTNHAPVFTTNVIPATRCTGGGLPRCATCGQHG
jgi:hypothetical protein